MNSGATGFLKLDLVLILSVLGLLTLGIAFIYSSGVTSEGFQVSSEWIRQIIWGVSGLALMTFFALVDHRRWVNWALPLYAGTLAVLILVLLMGRYVRASRAWLGASGIGIQPSEFGKLALIIMLSRWFSEQGRNRGGIRVWLGAVVLTLLPLSLVLMQPDLGTALVYLPILFGIALIAGVRWPLLLFPFLTAIFVFAGVLGYAWSEHIAETPSSFFLIFTNLRVIRVMTPSLAALMGLTVLGWYVFRRRFFSSLGAFFTVLLSSYIGIAAVSRMLKGYQMMRLVVFLDPQIDPQGAGWHIIQSVTAVGSGGLFGKGFLRGTQSHYRYLPEQSTDFIFSIIAEEIGFLGGLLVFALFAIIILRSLHIAYTAQNRFGAYIAVGIAAMFSFHVIENIGMAIGVMPITGIPLFFLSYGGSSLWTALMSVGLLLSIHYRQGRN